MSHLTKGSPEWFAAKKEARAQLDAKLAVGLPHGKERLPNVVPPMPKVPKEPKAKKPKAPKVK